MLSVTYLPITFKNISTGKLPYIVQMATQNKLLQRFADP